MSAARVVTLLAAASVLSGCIGTPRFLQPAPERTWNSTLKAARAAADSGKWATADRRLAEYDARYPQTDAAHESLYWRGLFRLAPGNDTTARGLAVPTLERYLARPGGSHRTEARVLLDLARAHATLSGELAAKQQEIAEVRAALGRAQQRPAATAESGEAPAPSRNLAGEVERLRADLAKANQELERIRRRLAGQRPG